ncbi:MAG: hypothetical protein ACR2NU_12680, partial [Aeoliella sp.]
MAQLASCPHCEDEFILPETNAPGSWGKCPACGELFALAEVIVRPLAEVAIVDAPDREDEKLDKVAAESLNSESHSPKPEEALPFGGSTLASFLSDANRSEGTPASDGDAVSDIEPLPARDRLEPTFGEVFKFGEDTATEDESGTFDEVSDDLVEGEPIVDSEISGFDAFKSTVSSGEELTDTLPAPEQPSFDFEVGGNTEDEETSHPTFEFNSPLDFDDNVNDNDLESLDVGTEHEDDSPYIAPEQTNSRGTVAARKRSSNGSLMRQMVGVAGGGVLGLGVGYLLLLWILHWIGRTDDPLSVAHFYPDAVKPATFQSDGDDGNTVGTTSADQPTGTTPSTRPSPDQQPIVSVPTPELDIRARGSTDTNNPPDTEGALDEVNQANFEQTIEPTAEPDEVAFDPLRDEPALVGDLSSELALMSQPDSASVDEHIAPAATASKREIPELANQLSIEGAPNYTEAQVRELTEIGLQAQEGLMTGEFSDAASRPIKGNSYASLAQLSHAISLSEAGGDAEWRRDAQQVFPPLFETEQHRNDIATIASYWWRSEKRRHGGIFFSGKFSKGERRGSVMEFMVVLPTGQKIIVVTRENLSKELAAAKSIGVVGVGLNDPAARIKGYTN